MVVLKKLRQYWQDTLDRPHVVLTGRTDRVHAPLFRLVATTPSCTTNDTGVLPRRERRHLVVVFFSKKFFELAHCLAAVVHEQVVVQADKHAPILAAFFTRLIPLTLKAFSDVTNAVDVLADRLRIGLGSIVPAPPCVKDFKPKCYRVHLTHCGPPSIRS